MTHTDLLEIEEEHVLEKMDSFMEYGKIKIERENVILFNKKRGEESLQPLIDILSSFEEPGNMKFYRAQELVDKANKVLCELPGDLRRQDKEQGTDNEKTLKIIVDMMKENNAQVLNMATQTMSMVGNLSASMNRA